MNRPTERGSVILWILIAVGLFAALGFAFSQGSRTSGSMLTQEQANAYAQQVISYGNDMKQTVRRLSLRGCKDDEFNFANDLYLYTATDTPAWIQASNTNSPSDKSCNLFDVNGGGMQPISFSFHHSPPTGGLYPGDSYLSTIQVIDVGTSAADLVLVVMALKTSVCERINEILGTSANATDGIPNDTEAAYYPYNTANSDFLTYGTIGETVTELAGKTSFCVQVGDASPYGNYYQVLIAR